MEGNEGSADDLTVRLHWPEGTEADDEAEHAELVNSSKHRNSPQDQPFDRIESRLADTGSVLEMVVEALARLEAKVDGRFKELESRLDDLEAAMTEPLPVDVSGIFRALEEKLFVPLDEMADSLAAGQGGELAKSLSDVAARLEQAAKTVEAGPVSRPDPVDQDYQREVLDRLDRLALQIEGVRRRIARQGRPNAGDAAAPSRRPPAEQPEGGGRVEEKKTQARATKPATDPDLASRRIRLR